MQIPEYKNKKTKPSTYVVGNNKNNKNRITNNNFLKILKIKINYI